MSKGHIPFRTCISCGAKRPKSELMRLGLTSDNQLVRDDRGTCQGRGAYVCNNKYCWEKMLHSKHLERRFRKVGSIAVDTALSTE